MPNKRFAGFTRIQFLGAMILIVGALSCVDAIYLMTRDAALSADGREARRTLCVLKSDYERRLGESKTFLRMTPRERTIKFGAAIGGIPDEVLQQSIRGLEANVRSMHTLDCA